MAEKGRFPGGVHRPFAAKARSPHPGRRQPRGGLRRHAHRYAHRGRGDSAHQGAGPRGPLVRLRTVCADERNAPERARRWNGSWRRIRAGIVEPRRAPAKHSAQRDPERAAHQSQQDRVSHPRPDRAPAPCPLRPPANAGREQQGRGICRGQPGLQAFVPPLSGGARVPGKIPHRAGGRGDGRHPQPDGSRRGAHLLWRPGFFQWSDPCAEARDRAARGISRRHVRCRHQSAASHQSR